jgi:hypothetical protein
MVLSGPSLFDSPPCRLDDKHPMMGDTAATVDRHFRGLVELLPDRLRQQAPRRLQEVFHSEGNLPERRFYQKWRLCMDVNDLAGRRPEGSTQDRVGERLMTFLHNFTDACRVLWLSDTHLLLCSGLDTKRNLFPILPGTHLCVGVCFRDQLGTLRVVAALVEGRGQTTAPPQPSRFSGPCTALWLSALTSTVLALISLQASPPLELKISCGSGWKSPEGLAVLSRHFGIGPRRVVPLQPSRCALDQPEVHPEALFLVLQALFEVGAAPPATGMSGTRRFVALGLVPSRQRRCLVSDLCMCTPSIVQFH